MDAIEGIPPISHLRAGISPPRSEISISPLKKIPPMRRGKGRDLGCVREKWKNAVRVKKGGRVVYRH